MPITGLRYLSQCFYGCKLIKVDREPGEKSNELLCLRVRKPVQSVTIALERRTDRLRQA